MNTSLLKLQQKIQKSFWFWNRPKIEVLPEGQMIISKNMIHAGDFDNKVKQNTSLPNSNGYEIYVSYQNQDLGAEKRESEQRSNYSEQNINWNSQGSDLIIQNQLKQRFYIQTKDNMICTIGIHMGSLKIKNQIDKIIRIISKVLLN